MLTSLVIMLVRRMVMQEIRWISGWLKVHNTKVAAEEAELDAVRHIERGRGDPEC